MENMDNKFIVGNAEWCALPDLAIPAIRARIDSGAKTSSIHAFNIKQFTRNDASWLSFEVHPIKNDNDTIVLCEAEHVDKREVKSSNGTTEKRFVIKTPFSINDQTWDIELTLTNRDAMGFRMLLGREAMGDRILIDPATRSKHGKVTNKQLKKHYG